MSVVWLPRSLVGRVFALYTVTLLAFVLAGLLTFYRYQFSVELEESQLRAETLSSVISPTVSDSAVIGDYDTIRRTLERAVSHSSFSSASFIDLKGGVVRVPHDEPSEVRPPAWLQASVESRLYDVNEPISVGGRDYGVVRLSFAPDRIAGRLWQQTRIAIALAALSVVGGLVLIRFPLVRWLGNLNRVEAFDLAMQSGQAAPQFSAAEETPLEFRQTFEVLGRAAANLQSQRAQASVTLAAIGDGVFTLDADGLILLANPAACAMLDCEMADLLGQHVSAALPWLFSGPEPALLAWSGRRVTLSRPGQPVRVLDSTLSPIHALSDDPDSPPVGHVLACRDVSEQHRLDQRLREELRTREAALVSLRTVLEGLTAGQHLPQSALSQGDDLGAISAMISVLVSRLQTRGAQLDAIFALSPDGFVSFDDQHRANYVSPAFGRVTGIAESRVLGASEREIEKLLQAQRGPGPAWRGFEAMRQDLAAGEPSRRELIELVRPQRRVLEVGLQLGTTEAVSQVLSLRDVTHETEVDQMKSEFLSTAAHELRTPMTSIYGFAELMMRRPLPPEQQREFLGTIHRQTQLMIAIVNELLDLARIEARRGKDFELLELDLADLARDVLHDFSPPGGRDAPVFEPLGKVAMVRVDRNKMAQAIGNVLSNAFKYSPAGGPVRVRMVRQERGGQQQFGVEVIDQGIGMSPEELARVSERFYRADASGNIPGTGLGMSIVKEIIELLGGSLALASEPGVGSRITLWLPQVDHAAMDLVEEMT